MLTQSRRPKLFSEAKSALRKLLPKRTEPEPKLIVDAQEYWNDADDERLPGNSHWAGHGPFKGNTLWHDLGAGHKTLTDRAINWVGGTRNGGHILEWGCGGGMNAVHFAPGAATFYGVDISADSLAECEQQLASAGCENFSRVLIEASEPEAVLDAINDPLDVFLCTYVFELLPTPDYGLRIVDIAHQLLKPNGIALIQIRYHTGLTEQMPLRHDYKENAAQMTTYTLEEFWTACAERGFDPLFVTLLPEQAELREQRYAYFALKNRADAT